jgi:Na+-driven multidrug efflux pump
MYSVSQFFSSLKFPPLFQLLMPNVLKRVLDLCQEWAGLAWWLVLFFFCTFSLGRGGAEASDAKYETSNSRKIGVDDLGSLSS